jgi:hypothetical protein
LRHNLPVDVFLGAHSYADFYTACKAKLPPNFRQGGANPFSSIPPVFQKPTWMIKEKSLQTPEAQPPQKAKQ